MQVTIKCNAKATKKRRRSTKAEKKNETDSQFVLKEKYCRGEENAKNKNTSKATQTCFNIWQKWASERKFITNASVNSSCVQAPRANPREFAFFFLMNG